MEIKFLLAVLLILFIYSSKSFYSHLISSNLI